MTLDKATVSKLRTEFPALQQERHGRPLIFMEGQDCRPKNLTTQ
jgi:hypothetical protein